MKVTQRLPPTILLLIIILLFFNRKFIPFDGNFIGSLDTQLHFWNFQFIRDQIFNGRLPFWNPYYYSGQPFLANPVIALFYPSTILFLLFPFSLAFNVDIVAHLLIAATGAYFLIYKLTGMKRAGVISAIIYSLNGYFLIRVFVGHLNLYHSAALIPWIFLYTETYIQSGRKLFIILSGGLVGLQILSGDAQTCFYTGLALAVFFFLRHIWGRRRLALKTIWRTGIIFIFVPGAALGIGSIQMIPSMEFIANCQRSENSYEYSTYQSFPPENFYTFLVPQPKDSTLTIDGEFTGYAGIVTIFLFLFGIFSPKNHEYRICFSVILILSIIIMIGHYTPIYKILYKTLPMLSSFRIPSRCLVMVLFCVAVFAGFGMQHFFESAWTKKERNTWIIIGCILLTILFSGYAAFQVKHSSFEFLLAFVLIISSTGIIFFIKKMKNVELIFIALLVLLFIDLYLNYATKIPLLNENKILKAHSFETDFKKIAGNNRIMMPSINYNLAKGGYLKLFQANGNASVVIGDYYRFMHEMAGIPPLKYKTHTLNPKIFHKDRIFSSKVMSIKYGALMHENGEGSLIEASLVMPRALLVRQSLVIPDLEDQIAFMKLNVFNPLKNVLLQKPVHDFSEQPSSESKANDKAVITSYETDRITVKTYSNHNAYLVLSELFYPGWHAYVDGEEIPILRANFLLRAVPLKSGKHQVVFTFEPRYFYTGVMLTLLTVILVIVFFIIDIQKRESP